MFSGIIEKKVIAVIKGRLASAEEEYKKGVALLEEELEQKKVTLVDDLVQKVIGETI